MLAPMLAIILANIIILIKVFQITKTRGSRALPNKGEICLMLLAYHSILVISLYNYYVRE